MAESEGEESDTDSDSDDDQPDSEDDQPAETVTVKKSKENTKSSKFTDVFCLRLCCLMGCCGNAAKLKNTQVRRRVSDEINIYKGRE